MIDGLDKKMKAILFDLDGTLLDIDLKVFIPEYLNTLALSAAYLIPPKKSVAQLLKASNKVNETVVLQVSNAFEEKAP